MKIIMRPIKADSSFTSALCWHDGLEAALSSATELASPEVAIRLGEGDETCRKKHV